MTCTTMLGTLESGIHLVSPVEPGQDAILIDDKAFGNCGNTYELIGYLTINDLIVRRMLYFLPTMFPEPGN